MNEAEFVSGRVNHRSPLHQSLQAQKDGVTWEEIVLRGKLLDRVISSVPLRPWRQN
jgi:hypothetical protein